MDQAVSPTTPEREDENKGGLLRNTSGNCLDTHRPTTPEREDENKGGLLRNTSGNCLDTHRYRVIVYLTAATTTKTGLRVKCELDSAQYPKGIAVSPKQMGAINITRDAFHGEWNYTIHPTETNTEPVKAVIFG